MEKETKTTLRIAPDLKELLKEEAKEQNRSIHNLIITILKEYFSNKKHSPGE